MGGLGNFVVEKILQQLLKPLVEQVGPLGQAALVLAVALALLIGGPLYMSRVNRERLAAGRKPRYGLPEKVGLFIGVLTFGAFGVLILLSAP